MAAYLNENDIGSVTDKECAKFEWLRAGKDGIRPVLATGLGGVFPALKLNKFYNESEVQAFFAEAGQTAVLSVRGTDSLEDWVRNARALKAPWDPSGKSSHCCSCSLPTVLSWLRKGPQVHKGFYEGFLNIKPLIDEFLVEPALTGRWKEVLFAGHSAGGAIATMAFTYFLEAVTPDMLLKNSCKVKFMSIGQPRVGNAAFRRLVQDLTLPLYHAQHLCFYRIQNDLDVVPEVPLLAQNYVHVGRRVKIQVENKKDDSESVHDHKVLFWDDGYDPEEEASGRGNIEDDIEEHLTDHATGNYLEIVEALNARGT